MTKAKTRTVVIKPFELKKEFTRFGNDLIDHVMPRVSPAAWKIITVILRRTEGLVAYGPAGGSIRMSKNRV